MLAGAAAACCCCQNVPSGCCQNGSVFTAAAAAGCCCCHIWDGEWSTVGWPQTTKGAPMWWCPCAGGRWGWWWWWGWKGGSPVTGAKGWPPDEPQPVCIIRGANQALPSRWLRAQVRGRRCCQEAASTSLAIMCRLWDLYFCKWLAMLCRVRHCTPMSSRILDGMAFSTPSCSTACTNLRCSSGVQSTFVLRRPEEEAAQEEDLLLPLRLLHWLELAWSSFLSTGPIDSLSLLSSPTSFAASANNKASSSPISSVSTPSSSVSWPSYPTKLFRGDSISKHKQLLLLVSAGRSTTVQVSISISSSVVESSPSNLMKSSSSKWNPSRLLSQSSSFVHDCSKNSKLKSLMSSSSLSAFNKFDSLHCDVDKFIEIKESRISSFSSSTTTFTWGGVVVVGIPPALVGILRLLLLSQESAESQNTLCVSLCVSLYRLNLASLKSAAAFSSQVAAATQKLWILLHLLQSAQTNSKPTYIPLRTRKSWAPNLQTLGS